MNPKEILAISRVFKNKIEKHDNMKTIHARECDFLKALLCEFAKIDVETYPLLAEKMNFPPFEHASFVTKGIENLRCGAIIYSNLGIIFKLSKENKNHFLPTFVFHRCSMS